jgi:S1-C subfamily serine protease
MIRVLALAAAATLPAATFAEEPRWPSSQISAIETAAIRLAQAMPQQTPAPARAWLGVRIQDVTPEIVASEGVQSLVGALVVEVVPGSPAMGVLVPGDIVLDVDNQEVISAHDLSSKIQRLVPGTDVMIKIWRDHAASDAKVKLGVLPTTLPQPQ